jgi:carbon storage regulator
MLVLTRKRGESIVVPHSHLKITVLAVNGGRVRLGIAGPPEVKVHREEIWHRLCPKSAESASAAVRE